MAEGKPPVFKKISSSICSASRNKATHELQALQHLLTKSSHIDRDISNLVGSLRGVPAPARQPYIFTSNLQENEVLLHSTLRDCEDIKKRTVSVGGRSALLLYLEPLADGELLEKSVIKPLMSIQSPGELSADIIKDSLITTVGIKISDDAKASIDSLMAGESLLLLDGIPDVFLINAKKFPRRAIEEAKGEGIIRGPHDAFNETLLDNLALIRRRTADPNVKIKFLHIGVRTKTRVAVVYVSNLVKDGLVEELERRLRHIVIDKIVVSHTIEEFIIEQPWSPFPQVLSTERPEKIIAAIYEGRAAVIVDNTPHALTVPCTISLLMQGTEDYAIHPLATTLVRFTRYLSALIAIFLPSIYIGIVSFHPGILPTNLAITVAQLRASTPFPSLLEAFIMEGLLEIFQEAVVRLPNKLSGAAAVVGAFVIGTTVVQAGLINPLLVVVMSVTAIASYSMVSYNLSVTLRLLRVPTLIVSSILGLYGMVLAVVVLTVHLCALRSFGESYLGGLFEITLLEDWKDHIARFPANLLKTRPKEFGAKDRTRLGDDVE